MATTTPNFGWPVPTSTDLLKNGATAIEGLGDAIDASMLDLKGGTTGQVLSKTSATDMDFTWVTTDDANAIQNAIVDAKGDLIAATANDTPARLAVGTNGQLLSADSTASTGLAWSYGGKNTAYTPTWGVVSGTAPSLGNGSLTAKYTRVGDFVYFSVNLIAGSTTTFGSGIYTFTLPFAMTATENGIAGNASALDAGVAWYRGFTPNSVEFGLTDKFIMVNNIGTPISNSAPFVFANTDSIKVWGSYVI